jgi:sugar phosphate isomerase/epimerase
MDRKNFMRRLGLLSFGGALFTDRMMANMKRPDDSSVLHNIGIQLFSVPSFLEKDFEGTIALLAGMGYKEIELFGPYPYSADAAKAQWNALSEMLGFSGSGYFGRTEKQLKGLFRSYGLKIPSMHTDLLTLESNMENLGKAGDSLGFTYVVLPAIPEDKRKTLDDYKRMADVFNKIGAEAKSVGLKFAYHNHGYGLSKVDNVVPLELLIDNTDPQLVFFEMDLFWTIAGRADPIALFTKYKNRYRMMHVKDMTEIKTFPGDGNDAAQWMALFPNMTSAGQGAVDLKTIIPAAKKNGVKHFFVEQDLVKDPEIALKQSIDYLRKL